jgi:hypothetical protein
MSCGYWEMWIPCGCYVLQFAFCLGCLVAHIRRPVLFQDSGFDYFKFFWCSMLVWLVFHVFVLVWYGAWTSMTYHLFGSCADTILQSLSIWVLIIMISEMLFTYRNPGRRRVFFSRVTLFLFTAMYCILGVMFSFFDPTTDGRPSDLVLLWRGAVMIAIAVFVAMPSIRFYRAITYPVVQPEDLPCVRWSVVFITLIVGLAVAKGIWNLTGYWGRNAVTDWAAKQQAAVVRPEDLPWPARAFLCCWELVAGVLFSLLLILAVRELSAHEIQFDDDSVYQPVGEAQAASVISFPVKGHILQSYPNQ